MTRCGNTRGNRTGSDSLRLRDRFAQTGVDAGMKEFEKLLADAELNAREKWDMDFIQDVQDRYHRYGANLYFTDKQLQQLRRIAK